MRVSFKTAKLAKEKKFDWDCNNYYQDSHRAGVFKINNINNTIIDELHQKDKYCLIFYSAPTQSELQKWIREKYLYHFHVYYGKSRKWGIDIYYMDVEEDYAAGLMNQPNEFINFKTYEEALEKGLFEALKLIPNEISVDNIFGEEKMKRVEDFVQKHKEETVEDRKPYWDLIDKKAEQNNTIDLNAYANGVEDGIKWQAERSYSEEDLREAFRQGMENMDYSEMYGFDSKLTEQDWFENYKKHKL